MAEHFKDINGQQWNVAFNVGLLMKLKDDGLDFLNVGDEVGDEENVFIRLHMSVADLLSALDLCTEEQRERLNVSREEFLAQFDGDTLTAAREALIREWRNFSQAFGSPKMTAMLEKMLKEWPEMTSKLKDTVMGLPVQEVMDRNLEKAARSFREDSGG